MQSSKKMQRTSVIESRDESQGDGLRSFVTQIGADLRTLAHDEVELARGEVQHMVRAAAIEAAGVIIGSFIAFVGLGLLCVTAVIAAEPLISSLVVRMLIMTAIYIVLGAVVAMVAARKMGRTMSNPMAQTTQQAKETVRTVRVAATEENIHA